MKNFIVAAAGIAVVILFFGKDLSPSAPIPSLPRFSISKFSSIEEESPVKASAWSVFEQYREFARLHDLEGVRSLSYQISDACEDAEKHEECDALMTSVYLFTESWQRSEFTEIAYDDKQVVLSTDYLDYQDGTPPTKTVIFFTRAESGEPRLLGIKFCFGEEDRFTGQCVNTDPATRDTDENGWWDDVEARFYK